jgi:hypothetical protein
MERHQDRSRTIEELGGPSFWILQIEHRLPMIKSCQNYLDFNEAQSATLCRATTAALSCKNHVTSPGFLGRIG